MKRSSLHIAVLSAFVFLFTGPAVSFLQAFEGSAPSQACHAFTLFEGPYTPIESGKKQIHLKQGLSPFPELYSTYDLFDVSKSRQTKADTPTPSFADSSLPTSISPDEDETTPQYVLISSAGHHYYSHPPAFPSRSPIKRIAHRPMASGVAIGAP